MAKNIKQHKPEKGSTIEASERRMDQVFDEYDLVSIAYSGGKDSGTVFNLAMEAWERSDFNDPVHVIHTDDEFCFPETEQFLKDTARDDRVKFWWSTMPVRYGNFSTTETRYFNTWDPEYEDSWIRERPTDVDEIEGCELVDHEHRYMQEFGEGDRHSDVSKFILLKECEKYEEEHGYEPKAIQLTGVRASESLTRVRAINNLGGWIANEWKNTDIAKAHPIYDIDDWDLWKAHEERGWDYNRAYDKLTRLGYAPTRLRTAHPFGNASINFNVHPALREGWPELLDRTERRFENAGIAFQFGGGIYQVEKDEDQTWEERVYELLDLIDDEEGERWAGKINGAIERHWERSTMPLPQDTQCAYCQESWHSFANIIYKDAYLDLANL